MSAPVARRSRRLAPLIGAGLALTVVVGVGAAAALSGPDDDGTATDPATAPAAPAAPRATPTAAASAYGSDLTLTLDQPPRLACPLSKQRGGALDGSGPGQPDPASAVALVEPQRLAVTTPAPDADRAVVAALDADGGIARIYQVDRFPDGWWPGGYTECR